MLTPLISKAVFGGLLLTSNLKYLVINGTTNRYPEGLFFIADPRLSLGSPDFLFCERNLFLRATDIIIVVLPLFG